MSNRNQNSKFDNSILNLYIETKLFMKSNGKLIVIQADKANTTVLLERCEKMENILNNTATQTILDYTPTKTARNRIFRLLKKWSKLKFTEKKNIFTKETNLAKAYGLIKTHRSGLPLRIVISCIDSPLQQLSDFYK